MKDDSTKALGKVFRIDESEIRGHLDKMVRGTVEETLNALLDGEADEMCQAAAVRALPGPCGYSCGSLHAQVAHQSR